MIIYNHNYNIVTIVITSYTIVYSIIREGIIIIYIYIYIYIYIMIVIYIFFKIVQINDSLP